MTPKLFVVFFGSLTASALAQVTPSVDVLSIDDCRYAGDGAAQAVWQPMRGSVPVSVAAIEGRAALRLACSFAGATIERASWDRRGQLDLTACQGVQFLFLCRDASPVSYFSLYFQSGEGWYHASFFPETTNGWKLVTIDKADTAVEGKPSGWGAIKALRLSAWRGRGVNTEFFISDIRKAGVLGADAAVAIVRAESAAQRSPDEARSIEQFTEAIAGHLRALDIGCSVISDLEVSAERLRTAQVVILPHNPSMPDRAVDELVKYARQGGRLLAFYIVPDKLCPILGIGPPQHLQASASRTFSTIRFTDGAVPGAPPRVNQRSWNINGFRPLTPSTRVLADWLDEQGQPTGHAALLGSTNGLVMTHVLLPDDPVNKRRMLLAMVGYLAPAVWAKATDASIARIGMIGDFRGFHDATNRIAPAGTNTPLALQALASASASRGAALKLAVQGQFNEAMEEAGKAGRQMLFAYCLAQQPQPGEFRAFWCHSAFGVEGTEWDEAIRRLATNGFTAILPNMLWGGAAFFPSRVLPTSSQVAKRGDQIALCLAACRRYGVQIHVWKVNWNLGSAAPKEFVEQMRQARRLQADASGTVKPWLCPSHPDNQRLEIDSMVEVARNYPVDGIHFDYIRYPDADHCFCAGCKDRFQRATGGKVRAWPKDVLAEGSLRPLWLDWRRGNITAVVKAVSEQARLARPQIKISAAVFPNWANDRDGIGQDWKLWCDQGYVDFVCPMDYTPSNRRFDGMVAQQREWAGRTPCYPGIGVSASSSRFGTDRTIEQILITRGHKTGGFVIFNYGVAESQELLPLLGMGITARR